MKETTLKFWDEECLDYLNENDPNRVNSPSPPHTPITNKSISNTHLHGGAINNDSNLNEKLKSNNKLAQNGI